MKWTIARRILAGFAVALLLTLLVAVIGVLSLGRSSERYQDALRTENDMRNPAFEALLAMQMANINYLRYMVEPNPAALTSRDSALVVANQYLEEMQSGSEGAVVSQLSQEARTLAGLWVAQIDTSLAAFIEGDTETALRLRGERVQPARERIDAVFDRLLTLTAEESRVSAETAAATAESAQNGLIFTTALVLLFGMFAAYQLNRAVSGPLQESSSVLASSSSQIFAAASQQAAGANETMAAVAQTVATVEEVTQTAEQASDRARAVAESAQRAADLARGGRKAADQSVATMDAVRKQVESTAQSILTLAERAQAISEIIAAVDDLADQTNLLALNASVEAARAGEAGRGFAVVAGEVRGLAEQSKRATVQVRQILGEIQRATNTAVMTTEQGTRQAADGSRQAMEAGETIRSLTDAAAEAAQAAAQIVAAAGQQAVGMEQIRQAITSIRDATAQNLSAARQTEVAAQDLSQLGTRLVELVGVTSQRNA